MEIKLDGISYNYSKKNYTDKPVLEDIKINFKSGKVNSIIGQSGTGKTTIIEVLIGELTPTSGRVIVKQEKRKKIGYVPQSFEYHFVGKTVYQELESALILSNYGLSKLEKRITDVLVMVNLKVELNRKINTLSFSEKKKLLLAVALIHNPDILVLDDPTSGLDQKNKNNLIKLLRLLKNRYQKTIIIASNDIDFVHKCSDYIFILDNKKIVSEGKKYDILTSKKNLKKYGLDTPSTIKFSNIVLEKKNIKIGYRDDINDLLKDIYRFVK